MVHVHTCIFRISDALVAADKYLKFQGKNGVKLCMSKAIHDMDAYIKLTDSVLDRILQLRSKNLKKVMMLHSVKTSVCQVNGHAVLLRSLVSVSENPQKVAEETAVQVCCG